MADVQEARRAAQSVGISDRQIDQCIAAFGKERAVSILTNLAIQRKVIKEHRGAQPAGGSSKQLNNPNDPTGLIASTAYADAHPFDWLEKRKEMNPHEQSDAIAAFAKEDGTTQRLLTAMLRKLGSQQTLEIYQIAYPNAHLEVKP